MGEIGALTGWQAVRPSLWGMALGVFAAPVLAQETCQPNFTATSTAGAMVDLVLENTCQPETQVTLHHNGMMISEMLDDTGALALRFPAFSDVALFMAEMVDGSVAVASADAASLGFYDRVAVQWQGDLGLGLHAYEFNAAFGDEGHVWREAPYSMDRAALGQGGFLVSLGNEDIAQGMRALVYTFPTETSAQNGMVELTVEAEVTETNCETTVEAQTLQVGLDRDLVVRDLSMTMPGCDTVGDFIALHGLVDPLIVGDAEGES